MRQKQAGEMGGIKGQGGTGGMRDVELRKMGGGGQRCVAIL